jgi:RNA 2',3'-cyclic 3'-phosphodiesterase
MADLRCFVAIELGPELREGIAGTQQSLARVFPKGAVRWVAPTSIHLTLTFLGDVSASRIPEIEERLRTECPPCRPFSFTGEGVGCFPNLRRPSVVWVGVSEPTGSLKRLLRAVERALKPLGFVPEERAFTPHLTLGRTNRMAPSAALAAVGTAVAAAEIGVVGVSPVSQVVLMRSELLPGGPRYTPLASVALEGRDEP